MSTPEHLAPRVHGGPQDAELRALQIDPATLLDFSVNTNPYGPCAAMVDAIRETRIDRYPDPTGRAARETIARTMDVSPDELVLGNGAAELLWTLARALIRPGTKVLMVEPTFCEFSAAAAACGAQLVEWRAAAERGFALELDAIAARVAAEQPAVVYLCTPNTPTGAGCSARDVARWAAANPQLTLVLDQSFLSLSDRFADAEVAMPANVVRIRSLTKDHAIPGVRVGYLIVAPSLAARVEDQRPAWMTSAMAQTAAIVACRERAFVDESRRKILDDRDHLAQAVALLGYVTVPSSACFFLVHVGDARELRQRLLVRHRVLVRDCASFGLPEYIRLASRPAADRARLVNALAEERAR
ncbi:MAG TPA: histidinol-phosphate transaminase [Kofleriaceae bacterium]|nr:histidinol-phosphate transaminase [Kofleriaceae bacterium]